MKTVRLLTCDSLSEAYLIKGRLNNEGIDCFLTNENFTNLMPLYNNMLGSGIQVIVNENDLEKSRALIKEILIPVNDEIICPHCGSKNIGLGFGHRKRLKILSILIAIFTVKPIGNLKQEYFCKDCKSDIK